MKIFNTHDLKKISFVSMKPVHKKIHFYLPLLIIIPFIIISFYNHPALDDWWYAEAYKQYGFGGAQLYWFTNYTARFFSNVVMTMAPLSFGFVEGYKILPVVFIGLLFTTCYYISRSFFKMNDGVRVVFSLWLTAGYLLIQRDYFESLYWTSANVVYQYTMLYWILLLALLYKIVVEKQHNLYLQILAVVLAIMIIGSNETLGGLVLVKAVSLAICSFFKKTLTRFSSSLLVAAVISWLVMFMAIGNWKKIQVATNEHVYTFHFLLAAKYSFLSIGYYAIYLLKQPSVWCLLLLSIPICQLLILKKLGLTKPIHVLLLAVFGFAIAFIIYFISIYPTGILIPPLRVTNIAIVFIFSAISVSIFLVSRMFKKFETFPSLIQNNKEKIMVLCVVFAVIMPTKFQVLLADIASGRAKTYDKNMYNRYATIKKHSASTPIYLEKLSGIPSTIVATDVSGHVSERIPLIFDKNNKVIIR